MENARIKRDRIGPKIIEGVEQKDIQELIPQSTIENFIDTFPTSSVPLVEGVLIEEPIPIPSVTFNAVITMHGGYIKDKTYTCSTPKTAIQISPLGSASLSGIIQDSIFIRMLFQENFKDPVVASKLLFNESFFNLLENKKKEGESARISRIPEKMYQTYIRNAGAVFLDKVSQYDAPSTDEMITTAEGNSFYGYKNLNHPSVRTNIIGIVYTGLKSTSLNSGYFLFEPYRIQILKNEIRKLDFVIERVIQFAGDHFVKDGYIETRAGTHLKITYLKGFNITQCRYFIASMLLNEANKRIADMQQKCSGNEEKLQALKKVGELQLYTNVIKIILTQHFSTNPTNTRILKKNNPFLVRALDFNQHTSFEKTNPCYSEKAPDGKSFNVYPTDVFPSCSTTLMSYKDRESTLSDSEGLNPPIKIVEGLEYTVSDEHSTPEVEKVDDEEVTVDEAEFEESDYEESDDEDEDEDEHTEKKPKLTGSILRRRVTKTQQLSASGILNLKAENVYMFHPKCDGKDDSLYKFAVFEVFESEIQYFFVKQSPHFPHVNVKVFAGNCSVVFSNKDTSADEITSFIDENALVARGSKKKSRKSSKYKNKSKKGRTLKKYMNKSRKKRR
jgi:hypothetical protein